MAPMRSACGASDSPDPPFGIGRIPSPRQTQRSLALRL
jgi:hypothetical protein